MRRRSPEDQLAEQIIGALLDTPLGWRLALMAFALVAVWFGGSWAYRHWSGGHFPVGPAVRLATWDLDAAARTIDADGVARTARDNHIDLIALQFAAIDHAELDRIASQLGPSWRLRDDGRHFAFIYNVETVREIAPPRSITVSADEFDCTPYQDTFRAGQFAFTLIQAHLAGQHAQEQATTLQQFATAEVSRSPTDIILCGDIGALQCFTDAGWQDLNPAANELLLIDPKQTHEWNGVAASVKPATAGDRALSYADFVTASPGVTPARP